MGRLAPGMSPPIPTYNSIPAAQPLSFPYDVTISRSTIMVTPLTQESGSMASAHSLTLLDVIQAVSEEAANEQEIVATVAHLISSGRVRLSDEAVRAFQDLCAPTNAAA